MHVTGWKWVAAIAVGCAAITIGACSQDPNGPGSYHAVMEAKAQAEEKLKSQGAKLEMKSYPQGSAWAVDLSKQTITDETWAALQALGLVAELDLSGTAINDGQLDRVNEIATVLTRLNLSQTEVTDEALTKLKLGFLTQLDLTGTKVTPGAIAMFLKKRSEDPTIAVPFKRPNIKR